ncbi:MAG: EAL domain-containing protein [Candidatus Omnitrophica bacterium]|nr:EAL domain-containing protein [Candidatus Omnitrophota bacterium]
MAQGKIFDKSSRIAPFYSVFQPVVDIRTRKIIGYEALVRGCGKSCLPSDLYRRSYKDGLTLALNLECLNTAFRILPKLGKDQLLFVNVEPMTFSRCFGPGREADFLILNQIAEYRKQVVFELTEGMKIRDFDHVRRGVRYLKKLGCHFAIDDVVGVGIKLLKILTMKPDFIKFGMALIRNIDRNVFQKNIADQLMQLARKCGAEVIAEGIERKKELDVMSEMGISYAQGYYFARPNKKLAKGLI